MEALQKELAEERRAEDLKRLQEQAGLIKFVPPHFCLSLVPTHNSPPTTTNCQKTRRPVDVDVSGSGAEHPGAAGGVSAGKEAGG